MISKNDTFKPQVEEIELLKKMRANPLLSENIQFIMNRFEQEIASGKDAHQAEEIVINLLQELGSKMMHQWGEETSEQASNEAEQPQNSLQKHAKKNSPGIQLSE